MSCPGLHCAGCGSAGAAVPVVPLVTFCGLAWVAQHLIEVAVVSAGCGALAVAAVVTLMRWTERREARFAESRALLYARSEVSQIRLGVTDLGSPQIRSSGADLSRPAGRPAIENHYHGPQFVINGDAGQDMAARLIRQALAGAAPVREEIQP